ncbi:MAG: isocitrate lyase/phosphoenolpyruvate mutase family protein [bacterium]|nr:isocitrate lyase/phosphoenolpyruvate mutase family protein [bacterium]
MTKGQQQRKAEEFLALHAKPELLVLPNAWDVSSARIYELEGFKAIGTTSAGVSATLGYPDGQRMSLDDAAAAVRRIVERIALPISADFEAGYATTPEGVAQAAKTVLRVGAVGLNLEDSTGDPARPLYDVSVQQEKIQAIREMATAQDIPLVINARTDVLLIAQDTSAATLGRAVDRANAYRDAGAHCIFVPDYKGLDRKSITELVRGIDAPLNVIAGANTPPLAELAELGVARVSFGPKAMRAALAFIRKIARQWLDTGTYELMLTDAMTYAEVNQMFDDPGRRPGPDGGG